MIKISNVPNNHGRSRASEVYLKINKNDAVIFDDTSHQHSKLGRNKLARKSKENFRYYQQELTKLRGYTWKHFLESGSMSKTFRRIDYKPNSTKFYTSIPESFLIFKNIDHKDIDKIGAFDYTKALRFGGVLDETGIFYIFWIDQNLSDIYQHTN